MFHVADEVILSDLNILWDCFGLLYSELSIDFIYETFVYAMKVHHSIADDFTSTFLQFEITYFCSHHTTYRNNKYRKHRNDFKLKYCAESVISYGKYELIPFHFVHSENYIQNIYNYYLNSNNFFSILFFLQTTITVCYANFASIFRNF